MSTIENSEKILRSFANNLNNHLLIITVAIDLDNPAAIETNWVATVNINLMTLRLDLWTHLRVRMIINHSAKVHHLLYSPRDIMWCLCALKIWWKVYICCGCSVFFSRCAYIHSNRVHTLWNIIRLGGTSYIRLCSCNAIVYHCFVIFRHLLL